MPRYCVEVADTSFMRGFVSSMMSRPEAERLFNTYVQQGIHCTLYECNEVKTFTP